MRATKSRQRLRTPSKFSTSKVLNEAHEESDVAAIREIVCVHSHFNVITIAKGRKSFAADRAGQVGKKEPRRLHTTKIAKGVPARDFSCKGVRVWASQKAAD